MAQLTNTSGLAQQDSAPRLLSLTAICLVYLLLGMLYAWATPPLESSDEYKHFPVVQHVQTNGVMPVLDPDNPGLWEQDGAQPPLYYYLMALITRNIDSSDLADIHWRNPHTFIGNVLQWHNKNLIIAQPFSWPPEGTIRAVYTIRAASILLGVGTIICAYAIGKRLANARIGLVAAALTAFNPMFLFTSAAVNNDSLANLLGAVGILLLVRLWQDQRARIPFAHIVLMGLIMGLGMLTKLSLGALLGLTGIAIALRAWQHKRWQLLFVDGVLIATIAFALAAPMFWQHYLRYDDITALNVFIEVQGVREQPLTLTDLWQESGSLHRSFWGLFGAVNIAAPTPIYWLLNLLALAGLGLAMWQATRTRESTITLLFAWFAILFLLLLRWTTIYPAFQGRLLFPGLVAFNVLVAVGWGIFNKRWSRLSLLLPTLLFIFAVTAPLALIKPTYAQPSIEASVPTDALFGPFTFTLPDGEIQLVGVEMAPEQSVVAGGQQLIEVALYWQMNEPVENDYVTSVHLLGREFASVGSVDRYPAWGSVPTSVWQKGDIYRDVYTIFADENAIAPARLDVSVTIYDSENDAAYLPTGPNDVALDLLLVGSARLAGATTSEPSVAQSIQFDDEIRYLGHTRPDIISSGDRVPLTLFWRATGTPSYDYTIFVHLINAAGEQVLGADSPPLSGDYPTSGWQSNDEMADIHWLDLPAELPAGDYLVRIGIYNPITGERVARHDNTGDMVEWSVTIR